MRILIASSIDPGALARLEADHDVVCSFGAPEHELRRVIRDREALVFRSGVNISAAVMAAAPRLMLLIRAGSGTDNVDLEHIRARGLELVRIPEPGSRAVAELTFGLMLALARRILEADSSLRDGRWLKHELTGYLLRGKVLGIVGAGNIGTEVGRLGAAWGMEVTGCVGRPTPSIRAALQASGIRPASFDTVVASADFLTIHVPLQASTVNLIDDGVLARMKRGAFLLNLARGGVVDELALLRALESGVLAGAALDVHAAEGDGRISPLASLPNVVLTPHVGATTVDTMREIGERVLAEIATRSEREREPATPMAVG